MAEMPGWFVWTTSAELGEAVLAALGPMPLVVPSELLAAPR